MEQSVRMRILADRSWPRVRWSSLVVLIGAVFLMSCSKLDSVGVANRCAFEVQAAGGDSLARVRTSWTRIAAGQASVVFSDGSLTLLLRAGSGSEALPIEMDTAALKEPLPIAGHRYADLEFSISPELCAQLAMR